MTTQTDPIALQMWILIKTMISANIVCPCMDRRWPLTNITNLLHRSIAMNDSWNGGKYSHGKVRTITIDWVTHTQLIPAARLFSVDRRTIFLRYLQELGLSLTAGKHTMINPWWNICVFSVVMIPKTVSKFVWKYNRVRSKVTHEGTRQSTRWWLEVKWGLIGSSSK